MNILQRITSSFKLSTLKKIKDNLNQKSKPRTLIINENLKFDAKDYFMFMLPYHPKIIPNGSTYWEIDTKSTVLELSFVKKYKDNNPEKWIGWKQRTAFEFTFHQLQQLLDVQMDSNSSVRIVKQDINECASYLITDHSDKKQVTFEQQNMLEPADNAFSIGYSEYSIFQDLLKESIYDLSGLPLYLDLKKNEMIDQIKKESKHLQSAQQEKRSFYQ